MHRYPIFLDIRGLRAVVVGGGSVGLRKVHGLLDAGPPAALAVIEPAPTPVLQELARQHPCLTLVERPFTASDLTGAHLVFACTAAPGVNARVAEACRAAGILCNCAQDPDQGTFALPACVHRGDVVLAVATGGASPALTRHLRQRLEECIGPEYGRLAALLGRLRPLVLAQGNSSDQNAALFRAVVNSPLLDALRCQDASRCRTILRELLPPPLSSHTDELCHACLDVV